ncbi:MAG: hypothetical protein Q9174_007048, partial [Haloplaca sp. 1 TL-2023]
MVRQHIDLITGRTLLTPLQSMLPKRKRRPPSPGLDHSESGSGSESECERQFQSPPSQLTRLNLLALRKSQTGRTDQAEEDIRYIPRYPSPYEAMSLPTPSSDPSNQTKTKSATSVMAAETILDAYRIFLNGKEKMPEDLETLVIHLKTLRDGPITPNSKAVKAYKEDYQNRSKGEDTQIHQIHGYLVYKPRLHSEDTQGEPMIASELNRQWKVGVPTPPEYTDDRDLQTVMDTHRLPARPKPDVTIGYNDDAFSSQLLLRLKALPSEIL